MTDEIQRTGRGANLYNPDTLAKMWDYFDRWEEIFPEDVVPTWEALAEHLGVGRQTLYDWVKAHPEVEYLHEMLMSRKIRITQNGGLAKKFDSKMAAIILGPHGYFAQNKTDHVSSDGSMSPKGRNLSDFYADADVPAKPES